ncbi:polysaccharide biosynthesis/export family protein [Pseudorhodobacter aquimaris]|uniref:polysaccharide biosynthesis/export family protein n=1 Tax=Pseudorhodobacter aquimaris TaxID=687412 RepID=UPI0012EDAFB3|nr:polysaccharide biosynthesis/export family protein [Pseudorhodobacter aquimaris]
MKLLSPGYPSATLGRSAVALALTLALAGCASLPGQGPSKSKIVELAAGEKTVQDSQYAVVNLTPQTVGVMGKIPRRAFSTALPQGPRQPGAVRVGIGDVLGIQIWEASPDGLFSTATAKSAEIAATVDGQGNIYLPYVGTMPARGQSVEQIRGSIAQALAGKAVDPEVVVVVKENGAQSITVVGDVKGAGRFDLPPSGLRLLDAVALSGGPSQASFDTEVIVNRAGRTANIRLDDVVKTNAENVWLVPRDTIQLLHKPRSFTAFGAVSANGQQMFETETVSLAEALAKVGGLSDSRADKGGVFLFRFEPRERLIAARIPLPEQLASAQMVPTIYQLDLGTPNAYFLAQSVEMTDKDIVYVASSPASEFRKFVQIIVAPFVNTTDSVNDLAN